MCVAAPYARIRNIELDKAPVYVEHSPKLVQAHGHGKDRTERGTQEAPCDAENRAEGKEADVAQTVDLHHGGKKRDSLCWRRQYLREVLANYDSAEHAPYQVQDNHPKIPSVILQRDDQQDQRQEQGEPIEERGSGHSSLHTRGYMLPYIRWREAEKNQLSSPSLPAGIDLIQEVPDLIAGHYGVGKQTCANPSYSTDSKCNGILISKGTAFATAK
mmetsp:Transcript_84433/g.247630  ORF Transcript_84433/g.247630 Transcript_84433/m.247630 type:complete len:216 (-) Transcript_84433:376-1023(-)